MNSKIAGPGRGWRLAAATVAGALALSLAPIHGQSEEGAEEHEAVKLRTAYRVVMVDEEGQVHEYSHEGDEAGPLEFSWSLDDAGADVRLGPGSQVLRLNRIFGHGGYLGVDLLDLTPPLRRHFGVPDDAGVMVSEIDPDSPAAESGLEVGDVITSIDGAAVSAARDLSSAVRQREEGEVVDLEVWRDGRVQTMTAALAQREVRTLPLGGRLPRLQGLHGIDLDGDDREDFLLHLDEGMRQFRDYLDSDAYKERERVFERVDWGEIKRRMEEAERKLAELEAELERYRQE